MFNDRFEGSAKPPGRIDLCFRTQLALTRAVKDEWAFVWDDALRSNIAAAIQETHFDVLLVNNYNVFWSPLSMKFKHAIVQVASVTEAVLQYMLEMVQDDPRVQEVLGQKWNWIDFNEVPMGGRIEVPEGQRVVSGIQQKVQMVLDRNTKMKLLIQAAQKATMLDAALARELDDLRDARNRIHIKTLTAPEYDHYTARMANDALDVLERFRLVALAWTILRRQVDMAADLTAKAKQTVAIEDDIDFGPSVQTASPEFDDDIPF